MSPVSAASRNSSNSLLTSALISLSASPLVWLTITTPATKNTARNSSSNSTAERNAAPARMLLTRCMDRVTGIARGVDQRHLERLVDLGPQPAHMSLHHRGLRVEIEIPHLLEQHGLGDDPP